MGRPFDKLRTTQGAGRILSLSPCLRVSLSLFDLARRLIRLRGLRPEVDIPIVYTGVRPGEKMHEELLGDGEERCPTSHPHIFRVQCNHISNRAALRRHIDELIALAEEQRNGEVVIRLRELVLSPPK